MPNTLEILKIIELITLVVIAGGTLVIGALVAPSVFNNLNREEAGVIMMDVFNKFDAWVKSSAILLLLAKITEFALTRNINMSLALALAVVATSLHIVFRLSPALNRSYQEDAPNFLALHKQSEILHKLNFIFALALLVCH